MTQGATVERTSRSDSASRLVADALDGMQIAERAYHHLHFSAPLVADLVKRVRNSIQPGDGVLLVGGNSLLIESLAGLGAQLDVWAVAGTYLTDDTYPHVRRMLTMDDLGALRTDRRYHCVLIPMLLEAVPYEVARATLRSARDLLTDRGVLIVASPNQAALDARLAALAGRPFIPHAEAEALSLSWPSVPRTHVYHRDELTTLAREAGLAVRRCDYVTAQQPFMEMELLGVFAYGVRRMKTAIQRSIPSTRNGLVMECGPRAAGGAPVKTRVDTPSVSVLVSQRCGGERLAATLASLARQTYPPDQYEVVVLDDGSREDTARLIAAADEAAACRVRAVGVTDAGARGRNAAMAAVTSDITAHTEDTCLLPEDWIESAIAWFDGDTAAVTGPVFAADGSVPRYLEVAGTRPDPDEKAPPSEVMFPISNIFYRTKIARAAGGFDETFAGRDHPGAGWDTELAWRLTRLGWQARFREEVYQFRYFPDGATSRGWVVRQFRQAFALPRLMSSAPELRQRTLVSAVFASRQTMYFDLAVAAGALAVRRRNPAWLLLATPWMSTISARVDAWPPRNWPSSARTVAQIAARQGVWLCGFIAGSIRARRIVL